MMKNIKIISIIIIMFFSISLNNFIFADEQSYELIIDNKGIVFSSKNKDFITLYQMVPGDNYSKILKIKNNGKHPQEIFIRAERVSENKDFDLLYNTNLDIEYNNKSIYKGKASGEDGLAENISLGTVNPGEEYILNANIELDGDSIGNEYQDSEGKVKWIFTTMIDNGSNNNDNNITNPDNNQNGNNNNTTNPDNNQNNNSTVKPPQTGDDGIVVYIVLSSICIGLLYLSKKRVR